MGLISRGNKSTGGTDLSSAASILAAELNVDYNRAYNLLNGNLDNANVKAAAGILLSKLDDASSDASAQKMTSSPGASGSESLATDLDTEVKQLRHAIERLSLGIDANRNDGSGDTAAWIDSPHRPGNLIRNGMFSSQTGGAGSAPDLWSVEGTPTTLAVQASPAAEGALREVNVVADAADEGFSQTITGVRADTQYLVVCRVQANNGTVRLVTTDAATTGEFRNVDVSETSSSYTTLAAVFQTDSTPTDPKIQFLSNASGDDFDVLGNVSVFEVSDAPVSQGGNLPLRVEEASNQTITAGAGFVDVTNLEISVTPPSHGYYVRVWAIAAGGTAGGGAADLQARLLENSSTVSGPVGNYADTTNVKLSAPVHYINSSPTPGTSLTYKLQAQAGNNDVALNAGGVKSSMVVELVRYGG